MSDPGKDNPQPPSAETARQEGAQGRVGKAPDDKLDDGSVDASDPYVAEVADQVHANA